MGPGSVRVCAVAMDLEPDLADLHKLLTWRMPFGRYEGRRLTDLPEPYLVWFSGQGFPKGKLGELLHLVYELKLNGLESLVEQLRVYVK